MNKKIPAIIIGVIIVVIVGLGSVSISNNNNGDEIVSELPQTDIPISEENEGKKITLNLSDSVTMGEAP